MFIRNQLRALLHGILTPGPTLMNSSIWSIAGHCGRRKKRALEVFEPVLKCSNLELTQVTSTHSLLAGTNYMAPSNHKDVRKYDSIVCLEDKGRNIWGTLMRTTNDPASQYYLPAHYSSAGGIYSLYVPPHQRKQPKSSL